MHLLATGARSVTIPLQAIQAADQRCRRAPHAIERTPCVPSPRLSALADADVFLKHEQVQRTGSFKYRGALNKLRGLREHGVNASIVAASSGNHGLAVATAAAATGFAATIYVPESADPAKQAAIRAAGGRLETVAGDPLAAELLARDVAARDGGVFVSPYNDLDVMAGQGTIGLELAEQCPDLDMVVVAVGGGGLMGGLASAMIGVGRRVEFAGVWPRVACSMYRCLQAGAIIEVDEATTISDGTAGGVEPGAITFDVLAAVLDHRWLVDEVDIARAMRWLAVEEHLMVEGSAALAVAPLLARRAELVGKRIAVVLCGRNVHFDRFISTVAGAS